MFTNRYSPKEAYEIIRLSMIVVKRKLTIAKLQRADEDRQKTIDGLQAQIHEICLELENRGMTQEEIDNIINSTNMT